jgi:release factor glutamine methyltransferase
MPDTALSLQALLEEGAGRLRNAGIAEPWRQALRLWVELSETGPVKTLLRRERAVQAVAAERFQRAVERRIAGEPLSHATGWVGFRHLSLRSDRRALIPRPETEGLLDLLLQRVRTGLVADVGTGGGCIALSLAAEGGFTRIVAVDSSADALALARLNRELVGAGNAVDLVQADLCAALGQGTLDALISNPPYLTAGEYQSLDPSVRAWEPALALVSGEDGLEMTTRLLEEGRAAVRAGGWLALEVDCSRAQIAARQACASGWDDVAVHVDLFGRERYLLARRSDTR